MKALSLSQPWCWSLFDPIANKDVENRSWPPPIKMIGETIAIHAAKSFDEKPIYGPNKDMTPIGYLLSLGIEVPARFEHSVIVGIANIDRVVTDGASLPPMTRRYFFGPYGWLIPLRRKLVTPIQCSGKQGLWTVPEDKVRELRNQLNLVN